MKAAEIVAAAWEQGTEEQLLPAGIPALVVSGEIKGGKTSCKILVKMLMGSGPLKPPRALLNRLFYLCSAQDLLGFALTVFTLKHSMSEGGADLSPAPASPRAPRGC